MDDRTRRHDLDMNPAAQLALAWHFAGKGRGESDMVVLPYRDRLLLFSRYLQQLVMESVGKKLDLRGKTVHQGLTVYGNKGSTDQHAFVQQLREGPDDFFVTFIEVLRDRPDPGGFVAEGITSGDTLLGFLLGTRQALTEAGRMSLHLTLPDLGPRTLGALIALYERSVGFYAHLIGINAYHQPGVEAGKLAAGRVLELQRAVLAAIARDPSRAWKVEEMAAEVATGAETEIVFRILEHLAANPEHPVRKKEGLLVFSGAYSGDESGGP